MAVIRSHDSEGSIRSCGVCSEVADNGTVERGEPLIRCANYLQSLCLRNGIFKNDFSFVFSTSLTTIGTGTAVATNW